MLSLALESSATWNEARTPPLVPSPSAGLSMPLTSGTPIDNSPPGGALRGDSTDSSASQLRGRFLGSLPETNLIGRDPEVARICSILDSVAEGKGHLLLVAGGPASGKTRLLQELTVHAGDRGFAVLTGTCTPDDLNRLYHPLLEAFAPTAPACRSLPIWTRRRDGRRSAISPPEPGPTYRSPRPSPAA